MMDLPRSLDEITPTWMTAALGETYPGIDVHSVEIRDVVNGACTKVRIALGTNQQGFPETVLMKAGFEPHSPAMALMHQREFHAYRDFVPTVDINTAKCHYAGYGKDGLALVILEDLCLRNVSFMSLQAPIGFDLACAFLTGIARYHARWWNAPDLTSRFSWAGRGDAANMGHYLDILHDPAEFDSYVRSPRGAAMPRLLLDRHLIERAHARMRELHAEMPRTVNHGDAHLGNMFVDAQGQPGFLDFQPCIVPWCVDVSYFIIASIDLVNRRRWEGALLQHYLSCLAAEGINPPSFDEAWLAYRRNVVWGLLIWMLNGSNFQTESNNTASATRFAMAAIDLDTLGSLGLN